MSAFSNTFQGTFGSVQKGSKLNLFNFAKITGASVISADPAKYEAWPSMAKDSSGKLYVVYRTCDTNTHVFDVTGKTVMKISSDNGDTWGSEIVVADNVSRDERDPNILIFDLAGTETILVTYVSWDNTARRLCCKKASTQEVLFGAEIIIDAAEGTSRGNPILLTNGNILVPYYTSGYCFAAISADGAETWGKYQMQVGISIAEQSVIETKTAGQILSIFRYTRSPYTYYTSFSEDYGETWSTPTVNADLLTDFDSPAAPLRFGNDILLFCSSYAGGLIYKSKDEGLTWTLIDMWESGIAKAARFYPSAVNLGGRKIGITWCSNESTSDIYYYEIEMLTSEYQFPILAANLIDCVEFDNYEKNKTIGSKYGFWNADDVGVFVDSEMGQCLQFNGASSRVWHSGLLDFYPDDLTLSIRFNANSLTSTNRFIFNKINIDGNRIFCFVTTAGDLRFDYEVASGGYRSKILKSGIQLNTWYHLIIRWSKTLGFKAYVDYATQVEDIALTTLPYSGNRTDFSIGANYTTSVVNVWDGKLKQFSVFKRSISDSDALQLFNSGDNLPFSEWP